MSNTSELISSEVRSRLSALAHIEPAQGYAAVHVQQLAAGSAAADDDPVRIAFLPANPRLADGDRFRKDVRNFQSSLPTKYLFGPDSAGSQEYSKSEALAGVIVGRIRPGALRAEIERKRDLYEASVTALEHDRARLARLEAVPADLRSAEDDAAILALQQSCVRDQASILAVRDSYLRAPGLLDTITAWIHETRPHAARRALTEPYTGEDPRSWHDWFLPLVRHTLPPGQQFAAYYADCLRTALEARSTSEDPEYQNLDVRMAGFAQANERTLREFLTALRQRLLANNGAISPLELDNIFVEQCKRHGCCAVFPPALAAADRELPEAKRTRILQAQFAEDESSSAGTPAAARASSSPGPAEPRDANSRAQPSISARGSSWAVQSRSPAAVAEVLRRMSELGYPEYPPSDCYGCSDDPSVPVEARRHWANVCPKRTPFAPVRPWVRRGQYYRQKRSQEDAADEQEYWSDEGKQDPDEVCGRCGEAGHHHSACSDPPTRAARPALPVPSSSAAPPARPAVERE
eukprot:tig00020927_g15936.t1